MILPSIETTLVEVTRKLGTEYRVFLKNELEQPSGSFKLRGLGYLIGKNIQSAKEKGMEGVHVFSSSGGNAGLAAAYAAQFYKVPCTVVLPITSKQIVVEKLKSFGAEVIVTGAHWGEADAYLREHIKNDVEGTSIYPIYCHPFDDPEIWEGHGDIIDELVQQLAPSDLRKVKAVVCSVGGGGLYNGIVRGLERNGLEDTKIVAIETWEAPTFTKAVEEGKSVELEKVNTMATSLASPYISEKALENYNTSNTLLATINDIDALRATVEFYDKFNKLVEPACGASLAAVGCRSDVLEQLKFQPDDILILVACGGSGVSPQIIQDYRKLLHDY